MFLVHEETTGMVTVRTWKTWTRSIIWKDVVLAAAAHPYLCFVPVCCCCTVRNCPPGWWEGDERYQDGTAKAEPLTPICPLRHPGPENEMTSAHKGRYTFSYLSRHLYSIRGFFFFSFNYKKFLFQQCGLIFSVGTFIFLKNLVPFPPKLPRKNYAELNWVGTNKKLDSHQKCKKLRWCVCISPLQVILFLQWGTPAHQQGGLQAKWPLVWRMGWK